MNQLRFVLATTVLCFGLCAVTHAADEPEFSTGSNDVLLKQVNSFIRQGWTDNEVSPSPVASDEEWMRRVYLDILGHIPPVDELEAFLKDRDPAKRSKLIDQLLDDPSYIRNWTTVWTNISIGRQTPDRVSRLGMEKFYREVFARNRPWNEVVYDVVTAEGHFEENGAVNFILAQMTMPDEGVQLTAKFTRVFLGLQVQCTQCHDHPFNEWKQDQFWQFNSFFRQSGKVDHRKYDPETGRMVDDFSEVVWNNINQEEVFFERRNGIVRPAYPIIFDKKIDPAVEIDRRVELGKLLKDDADKLVARAMVNRMWGHFFGYGFTKPVDDIGPHNPASHPELLDLLTDEFVKSRYDVKQLIRWVANSEAYNLTSQVTKSNTVDNPSAGEVPLFSHMYVKAMEAEQLFDSLIIATSAHKSGRGNFEQSEQQRQEWMQQFILAFGTDENDEATTFNGSIPQALMMMNGELTTKAVNLDRGSYLFNVLASPGNDRDKLNTLYLASLGRYPNGKEVSSASALFRTAGPNKALAYQDLFWALLNSNEFIVNH